MQTVASLFFSGWPTTKHFCYHLLTWVTCAFKLLSKSNSEKRKVVLQLISVEWDNYILIQFKCTHFLCTWCIKLLSLCLSWSRLADCNITLYLVRRWRSYNSSAKPMHLFLSYQTLKWRLVYLLSTKCCTFLSQSSGFKWVCQKYEHFFE